MRRRLCTALLAAALVGAGTSAWAQAPFYQGRTLTIDVPTSPGGGYDFYARLLGRHIARYLPGSPTIAVKNMPGGGGLTLDIHLFNTAPKDGTEIGLLDYGSSFAPLLSGVKSAFEPVNFGWLGSLDRFTPIALAWHATPFRSIADLKSQSMNVGAPGAGSNMELYARVLNAVLGTKFKIISGYPGTQEITLAMERGEVDGLTGWCWTCMKAQRPDWVTQGKGRVLIQLAVTGDAELTAQGVPTALELAPDQDGRRMLEVVFAGTGMARPFAAPPGLPEERLASLRRAFAAAAADSDLVSEAVRSGNTINYVPPDAVRALIAGVYATDPALIQRVRAAERD